jgi:hypothetical protein
MVETGDGRIFTGGLKMALTSKQVRTSSIDADWYCCRCSKHNVRPAIRTRGEAGKSPIQALVLSDQNFPAVLPVSSGDQCIKVLRIENGSVPALVEYLLGFVGNRRMPPGSIILIGSVAHLADVGISAYISDIIEASTQLRSALGRDVKVGVLPPLLLTGIDSAQVLSEIFELAAWAKDFYPQDCFLEDSFKTALEMIRETGDRMQRYLEPKRMRLPARETGGSGMTFQLWHSGGTTVSPQIPASTTALQQPEETRLIKQMITELRDKLAVDLDPNQSFERGLGGQSRPKQARDFMVVGSSNASKLASALAAQGYTSCVVFTNSWRISPQNVDSLMPKLKEAIHEMDPAVSVLLHRQQHLLRQDSRWKQDCSAAGQHRSLPRCRRRRGCLT